jgi:rsbT co-antagonist protein RsbR
MRNKLHHWLQAISLTDPIEHRQAVLAQAALLLLIGASVLALPLAFINSSLAGFQKTLAAILITFLCSSGSLVILRRGRLRLAINVATVGGILALMIPLLESGINRSADTLLIFLIPVTLAGLLGGRWGAIVVSGLGMLVVHSPLVLAQLAPQWFSNPLPQRDMSASISGAFILVVVIIGLFLDRFNAAFRESLHAILSREQDLERLSVSLEAMVAERTASLEAALRTSTEREARLVKALSENEQQRQTIRELTTPVFPVSPVTLVMPLIGALDSGRLSELQTRALQAVEGKSSRYLVLDITSVVEVDSQVAQGLMRVVQAVQLLGAEAILVGIRPEVAHAIVGRGLDLQIRTFSDLQSSLSAIEAGLVSTHRGSHKAYSSPR